MNRKLHLPIPLTCSPQIVEGQCVHVFDSGACDLETEFFCPYFLQWEKDNPKKVGEIPEELLERIRGRSPISFASIQETPSAAEEKPAKKAAVKKTAARKPAARRRKV